MAKKLKKEDKLKLINTFEKEWEELMEKTKLQTIITNETEIELIKTIALNFYLSGAIKLTEIFLRNINETKHKTNKNKNKNV